MLAVDLESVEGVAQIHPSGNLREEDFKAVEAAVDNYLLSHGKLKGLLIHSESFPGWDSLSALVEHLKFIGEYHRYIKKIAVVTDSPLGNFAENLVDHFVAAEVRHYRFDDLTSAGKWLLSEEKNGEGEYE